MKKYIIILLFGIVYNIVGYSQTPGNLQKYWHYRERLNKFVKVGDPDKEGMNIPAERYYGDTLFWDDGNGALHQYLGVLATEYRLLKNSGNKNDDYLITAKELYYAIKSFERLDATAESFYRGDHAKYDSDLNGFFKRTDVRPSFWKKYGKDGTDPYFKQKVFNYGDENIYGDEKFSASMDTSENSLDNVVHLIEAFSLINDLVDNEYVDGQLIDFKKLAKDNVRRMIQIMIHTEYLPVLKIEFGRLYIPMDGINTSLKYFDFPDLDYNFYWTLLSSNWYITNPVTNSLVPNGNGLDFTMNYASFGFAETGKKILKENFPPLKFSNTLFRESLTTDLLPFENLKFSFDVYNRVAPTLFGPVAYINAGFTISKSGYAITLNKLKDLPFYETIDQKHYKGELDISDELSRILCTTGNINGLDGKSACEVLLHKFDISEEHKYEHLPLVWSILNNNYAYLTADFMGKVKHLLDIAPVCGPSKIKNEDGTLIYEVPEWSSSTRLVWPNNLGENGSKFIGYYNGLDYMLLHNLYLLSLNHSYPSNINFTMPASNIPNPLVEIATDKIDCSQAITLTDNSLEFLSNTISLNPGFKIQPGNGSFVAHTFSGLTSNYDPSYFAKVPLDNYPSCESLLKSEKAIASSENKNLNKEDANNAILVYPNPCSESLEILCQSGSNINKVEIYSVTNLVLSISLSSGQNAVKLNISGLKSGVYLVKTFDKNNIIDVKKIIKK